MSPVRFGLLSLSPVLAFTLGCGSSTEPKPPTSATYVLQRVAGDALPTIINSTAFGRTTVYADTIRLAPDGTGSKSESIEVLPLNGDPSDGVQLVRTPIHYRLASGRIEIDFDCPPGALCIAPPHMLGAVGPGELQVRWGPHLSGREPLEYVQATGD
jgi:hypothetical protein